MPLNDKTLSQLAKLLTKKNQPGGVAVLDSAGKLPGGNSTTPTSVKTADYTAAPGEFVLADASQSAREVYDVTTTATSPIIGSATAAFTAADVNQPVWITNVPTGTKILSVQSAIQATLTNNAGATQTAQSMPIGSGRLAITLPASAPVGSRVIVKKIDSSGKLVTVLPSGADTIDGGTSFNVPRGGSREFVKDSASTWMVMSNSSQHQTRSSVAGSGLVLNVIGDSIAPPMQPSPNWGPYSTVGVKFGSGDYLAHIHLLSDGRILYGKVAGVGSQRADQMLGRISQDALSHGGHFCLIQTGTNDASQGRTLAAYSSDIKAMCDRILAAGQIPVLTTPVPCPVGGGPDARLQSDGYRRFVVAYAADNGFPLVDWYSILVDGATGGYLAAYDSGDGVHPSVAGKRVMAQAVVDALTPILTPWKPPVAGINTLANTYSMLANGLFLTDIVSSGQTAGDGVPDGWAKAGTATIALVTNDATIKGNAMRMTGATAYSQVATSVGLTLPASAKGHRVAFTGKIKNDSPVAVSFQLGSNGTSPVTQSVGCGGTGFGTNGWKSFYMEGKIPADATTLGLNLFTNGDAGGLVDASVAQVGVYDLTAAGV